MEWLILTLIVGAVEFFVNQDNRRQAKQDALELQHDQQQFESDETDEARQWQEDFYLKYQSPEALMNQYRGMGASESASLMSALGVSPSTVQSPQARSGISSGLGAGVNTMSDLLNSLTGGFNQFMQGQKANVETEWTPRVNQANIDATLGQLDINWKKFGLDMDTYNNISVPLANMALDKSRQEIDESKARIKEIDSKILQIEQQIKESQQNVEESKVRTDLYGEQINTEIAKQENLSADTGLKIAETGLVGSQTINQDIQNALDSITKDMSITTGLDVRLDYTKNAQYKLDYVTDKILDVALGRDGKSIKCSWSEFSTAVNKTYDGLLNGINKQAISNKAVNTVNDYFENLSDDSSYKKWYRNRGKQQFKKAHNRFNNNVRYGM